MIVLASQSASRRAMLEAAGIPFRAQPAHVDERGIELALGDAGPAKIALELAKAKALAVFAEEEVVLGSDSLVACGGRRFDKPASREQAAEHLRFFSGKVMELHSAAALVRDGDVLWAENAVAQLHVADLSNSFIESYLEAEWPAVAGCVGVFRIEARGVQLFEKIEGDYFTILGMPLLKVQAALRKLGVMQQ
ncbi:MAG: septum formation protein Maf [Novosphingobium sp.]|jgi:septum formation protein|uniref:Nucleoside triphosphate pyrophosphatase n=1 Tax=Novosphingobium indicum TaxID=462949 RepID=A0ABQ2J9B4_9SPHN|nr:nucleoside triphosphate pyrophosphatase [Novosphingobium indicum]MAC56836.1 septum formation protein Maf [Novosphingobium sp.]GGN40729.1 Maf-like protein [Novosphingobium indicum]|tara:strand:- start:1036 stop:1614 length:579 start_codon:yes stop_codon:yes gene_type:complete